MIQIQTYLINGSFNASISPLDRGFAYGDGVFRTIKMQGGLPEHWPQHYQKLVADCAAINIVCPSAELLMSDLQQLFLGDAENADLTAVAKIIVTFNTIDFMPAANKFNIKLMLPSLFLKELQNVH